MMIRCVVIPLAYPAPAPDEDLEAVEMYVCRDFDSHVPRPEPKKREPVLFVAPTGSYNGGLRFFEQSRSVYLCPDLYSVRDGSKISLAKILDDNRVKPRAEIDVRIGDGRWEIGV